MWNDWWTILLGIVGGLMLVWAVLVVVLWLAKPGDYDLKDALRLLPDLIVLDFNIDGDTARRLKNDVRTMSIPLIALAEMAAISATSASPR